MGETSFLRSLGVKASKRIKPRNLIIVSDEKVTNLNITRRLQYIGIFASIACICWVSFSTGSFIAAVSALRQRDLQSYEATMEKLKMQQEFALVKRDLVRLSSEDKLDGYAKFILQQYTDDNDGKQADNAVLTPTTRSNVMERIAFLEKELLRMQKSNQKLVSVVRERAEGKIADIDQLIASTGLSRDRMTASAEHVKKPIRKLNGNDKDESAPSEDNVAPADEAAIDGEGGPYVPEDEVSAQAHEHDMLSSLDTLGKVSDLASSLPLTMPIQSARFMSGFGRRVDPFTHRAAIHEGLDLAGPPGSKIMAANNGKITFSGRAAGYGNMVEIDHGHGISTRYGHMSKILVEEGQEVKKDQQIGIQGSTGRSTGAHLHYEVRFNDEPLNPANFLKATKNVFSLR